MRLGDDFAVALALQVRQSEAEIDVIVDHWRGETEFFVVLAVVAAGCRHGQGRGAGDIAGNIFDRAGDGVLPVQRALRAAQYLEVLHIDHVEQRSLRPRHIDIVDVHADARLESPQRVALTDAADIDVDGAGGRAVGGNLQVRHETVQVLKVCDVLGL